MGFWHFLGEPAWQGVGALIALVALVLALWAERRRLSRKAGEQAGAAAQARDLAAAANGSPQDRVIRYFPIIDNESERLFYEELTNQIRNAKEMIYRLSRGFYHPRRSHWYEQVIEAEETALRHDVDITRIQVAGPVADGWAKGYASLMEKYPKHFHMAVDHDNSSLNDICLIDPYGHNPVVNFLFETRDTEHLGPSGRPVKVGRPVMAIFILNERILAKTLADQLAQHEKNLARLAPDDVRSLTLTYVYFGWGVHMARQKMQLDVPGAEFVGKARLHGWKRDIHHVVSGPAVRGTIRETGDDSDHFDGVAYELSWWDKQRLDRLERRAYKESQVEIEYKGIRRKPLRTCRSRPAGTRRPNPPEAGSIMWSRGPRKMRWMSFWLSCVRWGSRPTSGKEALCNRTGLDDSLTCVGLTAHLPPPAGPASRVSAPRSKVAGCQPSRAARL